MNGMNSVLYSYLKNMLVRTKHSSFEMMCGRKAYLYIDVLAELNSECLHVDIKNHYRKVCNGSTINFFVSNKVTAYYYCTYQVVSQKRVK